MDRYEATRIVLSRIQGIDPENASKIMGLLLIQDHGEKEMIRLAFGPEALVHSLVLKARNELGLSSPSSTPSSPFTNSTVSRQSSSSSRLGFNIPPSLTIPNPSSSASSSNSSSSCSDHDHLISPSNSTLNPASLPFYANGTGGSDLIEEFQLQDQLSLFTDNPNSNLGPRSPDLYYSPQQQLDPLSTPTCGVSDVYWGVSGHRRSFSVSDILGSEDLSSGYGWRPCMYYARGYCKNGSNCRFVHGGIGEVDGSIMNGSPNSSSKIELMEPCHDKLRSTTNKSAQQQQRLAAAAQLMAGSGSFPYSPKSMNFLLQQQQPDSQRVAAAAALMMGGEMHKFGRCRLDMNDLVNPASRQIYLTFPADSTFREEDVSSYFSTYGPVQDVRIPYQQKRMFGFVTFVYPETVKIILAKGNPHFVCDSRVLVKPYKEKGKVPDKKLVQVERGEFSPCGTPTGLDSRDPFDIPIGSRMLNNAQDMLWKRKLEGQSDLQQALELQSRRLMGLQLLDMKNQHHHRALSTGSPVPSPAHSPSFFSQTVSFPPLHGTTDLVQDTAAQENGIGKDSSHGEESDLQESLEHNLPDSPFASPTKGYGRDYFSSFINGAPAQADMDSTFSPSSSSYNTSRDITSFKSFNCQLPRFSSGRGAIGMYAAGTGGPTCPTCPVGI